MGGQSYRVPHQFIRSHGSKAVCPGTPHRLDPARGVQGVDPPLQGREGFVQECRDFQHGRISRPRRKPSPKLPPVHDRQLLLAHRHQPRERELPRRYGEGSGRRMQTLRGQDPFVRQDQPLFGRCRRRRPHRLQRARFRPYLAYQDQNPDTGHHHHEFPLFRRRSRTGADHGPDRRCGNHHRCGGSADSRIRLYQGPSPSPCDRRRHQPHVDDQRPAKSSPSHHPL